MNITNLGNLLQALDENAQPRIMPASYWRDVPKEARFAFGLCSGVYILPTFELVDHLRALIAGRDAIEIGAGNGVLARALGIRATDSYQQAVPEYRARIIAYGQMPVAYGADVEKIDAARAVRKYRPRVVVGAWVTHKYSPLRPSAEGNEIGIDEDELLDQVESYIFVGNRTVHAAKSIWDRPHTIEHPDYVFSRAMNGSKDFIAVWQGRRKP